MNDFQIINHFSNHYELTRYQLNQGSQTLIGQRATFERENAPWAAVHKKKAYGGYKLLEKLWKQAKFDQKLTCCQFLRCPRAAQMHLVGHMRPAGRVFETPELNKLNYRAVVLKLGVTSTIFKLEDFLKFYDQTGPK